MISMKRITPKAIHVCIGCCVLSTLKLFIPSPADQSTIFQLRRSLAKLANYEEEPNVYQWARQHLRPLDTLPDSSKETVLLWTSQRSGGTTVRSIYECMGFSIAHKTGVDPRFNYQDREEVVAFNPYPGVSRVSYVNVDSTSTLGIDRAKRLGLISSGVADIVITNNMIKYAAEQLFDKNHKGRALALFRHPVERLASKFYYLQTAKWEKQYRPAWRRLDLQYWARNKNPERNYLVKSLAGKRWNETVTEIDLRSAMRTIEKRFIVGLTSQMEESVRRFNVVLELDVSDDHNKLCLSHFFAGSRKVNANSHPNVTEGPGGWTALAKTNVLDMRLYDHIKRLFNEQKAYIDLYQEGYRKNYTTISNKEGIMS